MSFRNLAIFLLFLVISSCKNEPEVVEIPLHFEEKVFRKSVGEGCDSEEITCTFIAINSIKAIGPPVVSEEINHTVEEYVIKAVYAEKYPRIASVEELAENFISDYLKTAKKFDQEPGWKTYIDVNILHHSKNILSIGITSEVYEGGAHGYENVYFLNFNPETGALYSSKELFKPGFTAFVEKQFRNNHNIPENDKINSTGFQFKNNIFRLPRNIGFDGRKVFFVYNAYEISPHTPGEFYFEIPKTKLKAFLKLQ